MYTNFSIINFHQYINYINVIFFFFFFYIEFMFYLFNNLVEKISDTVL